MKPSLIDAIRFPGGTRLQLRFVLKPLVREAADKALQRYGVALAELERAVLVVLRNDHDAGHLSGEMPQAQASVTAMRTDGGDYLFALAAAYAGRQRNAETRNVMLQTIGRNQVYFSRATDDGPMPIVRLRYADGETSDELPPVSVSVFTHAFAHRVPSALRSLLPAELEIAMLSVADDV